VCKNAVKTCIKREWSECSVVPSLERCNGFDDDCDGIISNVLGFTTVEESSCWCVLGAEPQEEEVCNGIDDDCNSIIDDNANCCLPKELRECGPQEAGIGVCKRGTSTCGGSMLWGECVGAVFPREEICSNELDDDCDGVVDNGCSDLESNAVLILAVTTALMIIFAPLGLIPTTRKKRITQPPKPMARPSPPKIAPKPKVPPKLQYSYTTGVKRKLLR
ncbi:MAG: hypothetical protein KKB03_01570, partial [Nanoarchaeota archaeon]|nr:hypothetical protein [Nanoarchaeota archaeon]MBU2519915.1 hypothetical protein [Nanoarchaeota archaeon]